MRRCERSAAGCNIEGVSFRVDTFFYDQVEEAAFLLAKKRASMGKPDELEVVVDAFVAAKPLLEDLDRNDLTAAISRGVEKGRASVD